MLVFSGVRKKVEQMDVADMTKGLAKLAFESASGLVPSETPKAELNGYIFYNA